MTTKHITTRRKYTKKTNRNRNLR